MVTVVAISFGKHPIVDLYSPSWNIIDLTAKQTRLIIDKNKNMNQLTPVNECNLVLPVLVLLAEARGSYTFADETFIDCIKLDFWSK